MEAVENAALLYAFAVNKAEMHPDSDAAARALEAATDALHNAVADELAWGFGPGIDIDLTKEEDEDGRQA